MCFEGRIVKSDPPRIVSYSSGEKSALQSVVSTAPIMVPQNNKGHSVKKTRNKGSGEKKTLNRVLLPEPLIRVFFFLLNALYVFGFAS